MAVELLQELGRKDVPIAFIAQDIPRVLEALCQVQG